MWSRTFDLLPGTESTATEKRIRSQLHRTLALKLCLVAWLRRASVVDVSAGCRRSEPRKTLCSRAKLSRTKKKVADDD
jgi:hypothetical protein